ncbi:hypothetical protein OG806_49800 [Streptomyces sp. NBC_00882]|uniref:hypothetical protein n=1 Tax=Streptomyces sp. NBC_00882 TaxID=2975856 RepID=UPI00386A2437|nr:hypothetical protein OG806_00145 [Streptomyces sp. NBC_00882]WSZ36912.1 hypothetical protein OG806_49800 [Streptomyces sp. NBC_00882]
MTAPGSEGPPLPEGGRGDDLGDALNQMVGPGLGAEARNRVLAHIVTCPKCKIEVNMRKHSNSSLDAMFRRLEDIPAEYHFRPLTDLERDHVQRREPRAERWASLAARIAGDRRDMRTAWLADLDGRPEDGVFLTPCQQRRYALGFLVAAVRFLLRDSLGRLWRPVDWILATRNRRESFVGVPPALLVLYIAKHDGVHTLLTEGWGWVGGCGVAMFALVGWLQRVRGVELAGGAPPEGE